LTFSGGGYRRPRQPDAVWQAVAEHASGADAVLVPGFPLTNDDHAWLHELLLERGLPARKIVLYAEQPYRYVVRREPPSTIELPWGPTEVQWRTSAARIRDLPRKRRAILAYRSQLPLLGLAARRNAKLHLMLLHEAAHGGEATAELESRSAT
jgi:hypothetical protein